MDSSPESNDGRLNALSHDQDTNMRVGKGYSRFIRWMRVVLPLIAVGMTVIVLTWEEAGQRVEPLKKEEVAPTADNVQNELLKPVFNSVDDKNQPYMVTAERATQDRTNPDIMNLEKPSAELTMANGTKLGANANAGIYQQKEQKLNLEGHVNLTHSDGYVLSSEELRVDLAKQRAFSGLDVYVQGPAGTIQSTGLEGDGVSGNLVFTGPAKVVLYSEGLNLSPGGK